MIQSFTIVNHLGESLVLDISKPEMTGFAVLSVTGLTNPDAQISTSEIALYDGAIIGNKRLEPRNIVMSLQFYPWNYEKLSIEEIRHRCYYYFPIKKDITFYVTNDSGTYYIKGTIESNETNIFTKTEGAQISILCPDPFFVKVDSDVNDLISNVIANFQFPFSCEYEGEGPVTDYDIQYEGPFVVYPGASDIVLETSHTFSYGNILIKKYFMEVSTEENFNTAIIGSGEIEDYTMPEVKDGVEFYYYDGDYNFIAPNNDTIINTEARIMENDITIYGIPYDKVLLRQNGKLDNYAIIIKRNEEEITEDETEDDTEEDSPIDPGENGDQNGGDDGENLDND